MPNVKDIKIGGRIMALGVGHNKSGKTCAFATFPKPIRFYDFDGRMRSVAKQWPGEDVDYKTVGPQEIKMQGIISYKQFCDEFEDLQDRCKWATVVIDSLTSLSMTAVTYQLAVKSGANKPGKMTAGGLQIPGFDEFNGETTSISQILDVAKILPCHVLMTAHPISKTETDKEGKPIRKYNTLASYGNKIAQIVPGYFDEIWAFESVPSLTGGETKRTVKTDISGEMIAATALPLPKVLDITNRRLFDIVQEEIKKYNLKLNTEAPTGV